MNIIWFSHRDIGHPKAGGAERTIYEIGRRLVSYGHKLLWVSTSWNGRKELISNGDIAIHRQPSNFYSHFHAPQLIRTNKPDIVVDDLGHGVPWGSEWFAKKGVIFFRHLHKRSLPGQVSFPVRAAISGMEVCYPMIYRNWPFITESNSSISDLKALGIRETRIKKILPGLNQENFIVEEKTSYPSLVYFGGMRDYKRPWEALYVLRGLRKQYPETKLFMIGKGPSLNKVINLASKMGVSENVTFTGRLPYKDLLNLIAKSWINIHSSITEGFGLSIIEASAVGTPTVAYSVPGVSDTIVNNKNGLLVKNGDRNALLEKTFDLVSDFPGKWLTASIGIAKTYSWEKTTRAWEEILENQINI